MIRRVLMTADTVGGVWTFALELAGALATAGAEVLVAALGRTCTPEQRADAARVRNLLLEESSYPLEWMPDPWTGVEASRKWVLDLARAYQPDIVHLNSFGHGGLAWNASVVLTAHSCVLSWWRAVYGIPAPPEWDRYRATVRQCVRSADWITAPSACMLQSVTAHYGPDLPETRVIYNGRSAARYRAAVKEPFILTAGRLWDPGKNAGDVARAAAGLPWPCCFAGESTGPFPGCRMLGFLGSSELAGWLARAAIYALPARYEPFGLSPLEAALSGCALVLGNIPSLREVWQDAALYVEPGDVSGLQAALQALIDNSPLLERMSQRAAARAAMFTPARMAEGYIAAYEGAMEGRRACVS